MINLPPPNERTARIEGAMVAEAEGAELVRPFNLYDREFIYKLPSGEELIISPHNGTRGLVTFPQGTEIKVRKIKPNDKTCQA